MDDGESSTTMDQQNSLKKEEMGENLNRVDKDCLAQMNGSVSEGDQLKTDEEFGNTCYCKRANANSGDQLDCNGGDCNDPYRTLNHGAQEQSAEDVPCDSCIESPRRAVKSCLTCLVSYCEAHLRPHLESRRFQSHRLVPPQKDLELRGCPEHGLPLELYCCTDARCLCHACREQGHREHHTLPVGEARRLTQAELQRKRREMLKAVSTAEDAITSLQHNTASAESSVMGLHMILAQQFSHLHEAVERAREEVREVLDGELKHVACQVDGIQAHLHLKICQLKRTLVLGEKFSNSKNDVDFMQEYCEWLKDPVDTDLPEVYISLPDRLSPFRQTLLDTTQELCEQLLATYRHQLTHLCQREGLGFNTAIQSSDLSAQEPEPVTHSDFLRYATSLTFNIDSAHQFLRLTEGNTRVTNTTPWQHCYPEHPERFEHWRQVLACDSLFLGRHYFEVELSGEGAYVGLTYKSIKRKSADRSGCITGNTFSWSLGRRRRGLSCWHAGEEICLQGEPLSQVGVYVDYQAGVVAFYGVAGSMTQLHKYSARFLGPLYPAFWLSKKDDVICLPSLVEN
ncbi:tripartite motif-containing protein 16-like protein [Alosa pseudoharengus]|uniref:tripartite motif-containing protein 16-like protein n=1 Tax=Alosa pseudoharengus TaxID=34774 RepID=UPI003F8A7AAC